MKVSTSFFTSLLLVLFVSTTALSQQVKDIEREDLQDLGESEIMRTKQATETKGTPYLNTKFLKGEAIIKGGATTRPMYLRLNTETNTVEIVRNKKVQALNTKKIEGFRIFTSEDDILFKNGFNNDVKGIDKLTFLRIIYDGNTKLVAHHYSKLKEDLPSYGSATKQNAYVSFLNYYVVDNGEFHKLKLNEDSIMEALSSHKDQLKTIAQQNELSLDNEDDVVMLLKKFDQAN